MEINLENYTGLTRNLEVLPAKNKKKINYFENCT